MTHRFRMDDYECCTVCGAGLDSVWRDGIHWFMREDDNHD